MKRSPAQIAVVAVALAIFGVAACTPPAPSPTRTPAKPTAAIEHLGTSTAVTDRVEPTLRIERPAAVAAGAVLLAQVLTRQLAADVTAPEGWTEVGVSEGADQLKSWVFLHVATESEPDAYEFASISPSLLIGSVSGFVNVDAGQPLDTYAQTVNRAATTLGGPALITNTGNTVAIWLGSLLTSTGCQRPPIAVPTGFRAIGAECSRTGAGLAVGVGLRQLGALSVQPRWSGRAAAAGASVVQVVVLRPVGSPDGGGGVPGAQAADRFAAAPAPSLVESGRFGYRLWDGDGRDGKPNYEIGQNVLHQPSGLAASRTDNQVVFLNSEKDRGTIVAVSVRDGAILGRYRVRIPDLFDWEDLAAGPCPAGQCLYAADIGSAREVSKAGNVYSVTRFAEPDVTRGQTTGELTGDTFPFRYPGGARIDAEALLVHPSSGDIYVVVKGGRGTNDVYRFPTPLPEPGRLSELVKVATLSLPVNPSDPEAVKVTAAAAHPVANRVLIRTYRNVYEFRGPEGAPLTEALTGKRVELTDPKEVQGEAITYAIDGSAYYTLSERQRPPYRLNRVDRT